MKLSKEDSLILEVWMEDSSFVNWANSSDPVDIEKWEMYFNEHPEHWRLGKAGKSLLVGVHFKEIARNDLYKEHALDNIMQSLNNASDVSINSLPKVVKMSRKWWYMAATIAAIVVMISGINYQMFKNSEVNYVTQFGEKRIIQLPDETVVTLNANSKLKYYSNAPRKVWLDGEAFFEVTKQPETNANFQVITSDLTVRVLGTTFNVNTRNDQTKVFLEEGKVKIAPSETNRDTIEMVPGDLIVYSKKRKALSERKNNASVLENASWKDGTLIFNNTPLYEALYEIEDIYGIQFVWKSEKLKEKQISGGVPITDLETTLRILKEVYVNDIEKKGNRYFIND